MVPSTRSTPFFRQLDDAVLPVDVIGVDALAAEFDVTAVRQIVQILGNIRRKDHPVRDERVGELPYQERVLVALAPGPG